MNKRTNGRTKVPLCSTGLRPLWGRCPKRKKFPICVKALVINPFGAAAQKGDQLTNQPTDRQKRMKENFGKFWR